MGLVEQLAAWCGQHANGIISGAELVERFASVGVVFTPAAAATVAAEDLASV